MSRGATSSGGPACGEVPVEHMDYGFIAQCRDVKYLESIWRVLRSGDEGHYPHLIEFCESHLEKLEPRSRVLRREHPVATAASLSTEEWSQLAHELKTWQEETEMMETSLKQQSVFEGLENRNMPPVRGSNCSVPLSQTSVPKEKRNSSKRTLPRGYGEWDKFDVEKECERIDGGLVKTGPAVVMNTGQPKIQTTVDAAWLTEQEKLPLANREKDKGNEAFRAHDYEEAVAYYSRSLSIKATVAAYNNRAQAEIKLKRWHRAMSDCVRVLELEPGNVKALLRRATVYNHMGSFPLAAEDLRVVLREEPQNAAATQLLSETEKKMEECQPGQQRRGKKIVIQEVEDEDECNNDETKAQQTAHPVEPSQAVGGEESSAAPERGDMGNSQKKPHGRGDGGPHGDPAGSHHHGHRRGKGASADKYKVAHDSREKVANGSSKRGSTASVPADQSRGGKEPPPPGGHAEESVNLDAPCGALPRPLARLKNEGNLLFKNGQFADALEKYSLAIQGYTDSGIDSPEDLCTLYSNRAACYLKVGNSQECIQDCTRALELQSFSLKPLLRRAMAYDSLERYRKAYVDYKTVLQIDTSVRAAHDSVDRITRLLIEQDGAEWRERLPDIPLVPLWAQQHRREEPPSAELLQGRAERKAEVLFSGLKQEGNDFVKKGQYQDALGRYSECLKLKPEECAVYTNRALCYLKLERFAEAKQDCDAALRVEPANKKAFYRRALANKGLKDYLACSSDLQEVLQQDPNVQEAEKELEEVTLLLRQSLAHADASPAKPRKTVAITEVEGDEEKASVSDPEGGPRGEGAAATAINLRPANAYEFGQSLSLARSVGDEAACADLLAATTPERLPQLLSTQLDGNTLSFIMRALDSQLLERDPDLVYRHLQHLHTADRFSVMLMLLEKDERRHMTQLFEHLSAAPSAEFTKNDVQNLANKYI
ncbi:sperm-associated antigen 1-like [Clinocottus analis]|uniref:sperm-associated antigen 1-like n=1 Tax=Clinocottus analis TaxID=304258 RepID=UPI0035BFA4BB